jgi:hypothetical protein
MLLVILLACDLAVLGPHGLDGTVDFFSVCQKHPLTTCIAVDSQTFKPTVFCSQSLSFETVITALAAIRPNPSAGD